MERPAFFEGHIDHKCLTYFNLGAEEATLRQDPEVAKKHSADKLLKYLINRGRGGDFSYKRNRDNEGRLPIEPLNGLL